MIRYISLLLITLTAAFGLRAQNNVGSWQHYPAFATPVGDIAAGDGMVYYVAGGNLFSYDTAADESRTYSVSGILTGSDINLIKYNPIGHYLFVAYSSGNIDLVYDKGNRVVNIPDIAESTLTSDKHVTDVDFAPGRIYIATAFGLIEYDDQRHEVRQAANYGKAVTDVMVMDDYIVIYIPFQLYSLKLGGRITDLAGFNQLHGSGNGIDVTPLTRRSVMLRRPDNPAMYLNIYVYPEDMDGLGHRTTFTDFTSSLPLITGSDGTVYFISEGILYRVDGPSESYERVGPVPDDILSDRIAIGQSPAEVWGLNINGLIRYDLTGDSPVLTMQRFRPEDMSVSSVAVFVPDITGEKFYVHNIGPSAYRLAGDKINSGQDAAQQTALISPDGTFEDVAVYGYKSGFKWVVAQQNRLGVDLPIAVTCLTPHPTDPDTYYLGTGNEGLLKITRKEVRGSYTASNSPMDDPWGTGVFGAAFDPEGNLWVVHQTGDKSSAAPIQMLPADKVALDPSEITEKDWISVPVDGFTPGKDIRLLFNTSSKMIFCFGQNSSGGMVAIQTQGTWGDITDDKTMVWKSFTDQDGKVFSPDRFTSILEDSRGRIWLGTSHGVIEIANPTSAIDPSMTVNHIKVPRNDGTNSADYLLDADLIYDMTEDHAGRKWLATEMSGLYLVSTTGAEIIEHFSTDNTPLATNVIHAVQADPHTNTIWVGTSAGLYAYTSDASPAMPDFSEVLVYPNPVRPEFTGLLTITGLMDGTLLKIADASGHVVAQLRSEGGMATWNCENEAGRRVPSGVYFVMLSSGSGIDGTPTNGAVAKFLIVN